MEKLEISRSTLSRPYFRALAEEIGAAILSGILKEGERLPPQRKLADTVGISLPTVTRAYEELERRGLVIAEQGRGTYVRSNGKLQESQPSFISQRYSNLIDLSILKPVVDTIHVERMKVALSSLAETIPTSAFLSPRPMGILDRHRSVAVEWLKHCGIETEPSAVHITNGVSPALTIALMTVCPVGSIIATDQIGLHILPMLASYIGATVKGIETDSDGILPDALERACVESGIRALFVMPNALSPSPYVMSLERREALIEVARKHDLQVIEDDAIASLIPDRPPAFRALAPERTLYATSFTKAIMPGLRIGYLVVPERLNLAIENRHLVSNWCATPLIAEIATRWIEDGTCRELAQWQSAALSSRHQLIRQILEGHAYSSHPASPHIWIPLPARLNAEEFAAHARRRGVAVANGSAFAISTTVNAIRLSVGASSEAELTQGLNIVRNLMQSDAEPILFGF